MSKETSIIVLGLWVVIMPYLGIYRSWLSILMVLTGLVLMLVGFLLRGETLSKGSKGSPDHPFIESDYEVSHPAAHEHQEGINSLN